MPQVQNCPESWDSPLGLRAQSRDVPVIPRCACCLPPQWEGLRAILDDPLLPLLAITVSMLCVRGAHGTQEPTPRVAEEETEARGGAAPEQSPRAGARLHIKVLALSLIGYVASGPQFPHM